MPALKLFGISSSSWFADDDLRWISFIEILWRFTQIGFILTLWIFHIKQQQNIHSSFFELNTTTTTTAKKNDTTTWTTTSNTTTSITNDDTTTTNTTILSSLLLDHLHDCHEREKLIIRYLWGYICIGTLLAFVGLIVEGCIYVVSGRGTPVQQNECRKSLPMLCQIHLIGLSILRICCVTFAIFLIIKGRPYKEECYNRYYWRDEEDNEVFDGIICENDDDLEDDSSPCLLVLLQQQERSSRYLIAIHHCLKASVGMHMFEFGAISLWCWTLFYPISFVLKKAALLSLRGVVGKKKHKQITSFCFCSSIQQWQYCCYCCFSITSLCTCGLLGGKDVVILPKNDGGGDFKDVAMALSQYFHDYSQMNIVPSDLLIGLYLVYRKQKEQHETLQYELQRKLFIRMKQQQQQEEEIQGNNSSSNETTNQGQNDGVKEVSSSLVTGSMHKDHHQQDDDDDDIEEPNEEDVMIRQCLQLDNRSETKTINNTTLMYYVKRRSNILLQENDGGSDDNINSPSHNNNMTAKLVQLLDIEKDQRVIGEGAQFMRYALAIYTWVMYVFNKPCTGLCELCFESFCCSSSSKKSRCCCCCDHKNDNDTIISTPFFHSNNNNKLHWTALLKESGLKDDPSLIRYASFQVGYNVQPYFICIDHEWESIVIAIRGTLSLDDALTDMTMNPICLWKSKDKYGFNETSTAKRHVHSGFLACAEWIYDDIMKNKSTSSSSNHNNILEDLLLNEFPTYNLRITGHSLGAGIAAILSILMKSSTSYGDRLKCLSFSPPGCTMDSMLLEETKSFITSYVLDTDIVPRIAIESVETLRNDVLDAICCMKLPKYKTWTTVSLQQQQRRHRFKRRQYQHHHHHDDSDDDDDGNNSPDSTATIELNRKLLHRMESMPESEFSKHVYEVRRQQQLAKRQRQQEHHQQQQNNSYVEQNNNEQERMTTTTTAASSSTTTLHTIELFPPGRIVHLCPTKDYITPSSLLSKIPSAVVGTATKAATTTLKTSKLAILNNKKFSSSNNNKCCDPPTSFHHDNKQETSTTTTTRYTPCWANATTDFREIRISSNFLSDHQPQQVLQELEDIATNMFGLEPPYNKEREGREIYDGEGSS